VTASAATLMTAYGAGSHPRSMNPAIPTVRDKANAISAPTANSPAPHTNHSGPPSAIRTAIAAKMDACSRNPGPMTGMWL
jgi:hypothetical protein